jgi:quercetin dioxygenase-like cupin family protein
MSVLDKPRLSVAEAMEIAARALLRAPDEVLDHAEYGPYLEKRLVERFEDGSARWVHRFIRPDADYEMHDHPWDNRTYCVSGGYWEVVPGDSRWIGAGDVHERLATDFHRVDFVGELPVTVFDHGPKRQGWGFLGPDGTKVPWRDFVADSGSFRR